MKTFGPGIDQFEYWEHSNPCTCGHGPPPQQSQPPCPPSPPMPACDGPAEEETAASEESPPSSPAKLRGAQPQPQEAGTIHVGSMGYADDTYPLRSEGKYMAPVMQLTDEWLALTLQKVNPKKSLSIQVRRPKEVARKHTVLQGVSLPLQAEFRSLGVGICTSLIRGMGPLLKKRTSTTETPAIPSAGCTRGLQPANAHHCHASASRSPMGYPGGRGVPEGSTEPGDGSAPQSVGHLEAWQGEGDHLRAASTGTPSVPTYENHI